MEPDSGTTNIRNRDSRHSKRWLGVESRCLVPFTSFSEFNKAEGRRHLAASERSGLWYSSRESGLDVRKVEEGETTNDLYFS